MTLRKEMMRKELTTQKRKSKPPSHANQNNGRDRKDQFRKDVWPRQSGVTSQKIRQEQLALNVRVGLQLHGEEVFGYTEDILPEGLRIVCDVALKAGTPLTLQCAFGRVCYLNIMGRVGKCYLITPAHDESPTQYVIDVKFSAMREWEQRVLNSAIEEIKNDVTAQEQSLLSVRISENGLANETVGSYQGTHALSFLDASTGARGKNKFTSDPPWITELKHHIAPAWNAILECKLVQGASAGTLSLKQMRAWMTQLYPFIETFPKWIALNIVKTEDPISRGFLIDNVRVEKRHAEQWIDMAQGFGINPAELHTVHPLPHVDALTHWLWSINTQGSLAEAIGATNYAIEGVTQGISKLTLKGFPFYDGREGIHLSKKTYWWMEAHAKYDDLHPIQALEIMKLYTRTKEDQKKVISATQRSLDYLLMALEACYASFQPEGEATDTVTTSSQTGCRDYR